MTGTVAVRRITVSEFTIDEFLATARADYHPHFAEAADVDLLVNALRAQLASGISFRDVCSMHAGVLEAIDQEDASFKAELLESARVHRAFRRAERHLQRPLHLREAHLIAVA